MGTVKEYQIVLDDLTNLDSDEARVEYLDELLKSPNSKSRTIASDIIEKLSHIHHSYYHNTKIKIDHHKKNTASYVWDEVSAKWQSVL